MEQCYDSILASLEATLMVKITLANLFCRLEKDAGGFMTHGERVQVEELAGSKGTQEAISVMISILRKKDANAFFKFCDILDKSGNEIWCEKLKSLAKEAETVIPRSPSIGGQLQPCETCMHLQAPLSTHRALTSECSHPKNEWSKEKAWNEVLGAKCKELEARNHSMKEAYDQELMLVKEENQELKDQQQQLVQELTLVNKENQELKDQQQQLVQESTLVNKENQELKDQQQQLTKNLHAKQDEIYQLKKCIEQLKAIQKGENSVSEIVSPRVFSGVSECLQCIQHGPGGGEYSAVAVNGSYIAVTDDSLKCVHVLSKSGKLIRSFGQGRLSGDICGVTFDKNGNILVADSRNHKVLAFAFHGEFVKNIERGDGPFNYPTDLAVSDNGYLYCCDRGNKSISIHDEKLDFLLMFGSEGEADVCFDRPKSLCIGIDNMVYISDPENRRIYVYNFNGVFQQSFLTHCKPNCIAGCGEYILVTSLAPSISVYTISGQLKHTFGEKGETPGKFNSPFGIAADSNGTVYVADRQNKRIQVFRLLHQCL